MHREAGSPGFYLQKEKNATGGARLGARDPAWQRSASEGTGNRLREENKGSVEIESPHSYINVEEKTLLSME